MHARKRRAEDAEDEGGCGLLVKCSFAGCGARVQAHLLDAHEADHSRLASSSPACVITIDDDDDGDDCEIVEPSPVAAAGPSGTVAGPSGPAGTLPPPGSSDLALYRGRHHARWQQQRQHQQHQHQQHHQQHQQYGATVQHHPAAPRYRTTPTIKVATWNINEFRGSRVAPVSWDPKKQRAAVLSCILQQEADVLCLQEVPTETDPYRPGWYRYLYAGMAPHYELLEKGSTWPSGQCMLFIRRGVGLEVTAPVRVTGSDAVLDQAGTGVVARLRLSYHPPQAPGGGGEQQVHFCAATMHFTHKDKNRDWRLFRMNELVDEITNYLAPTGPLVFAGDTNFRPEEAATACAAHGLHDCWQGVPDESVGSWDLSKNWYYSKPNQGNPKRKPIPPKRYDRILLRDCTTMPAEGGIGGGLRFFANEQVTEQKYHCLSDHFGLAATVRLA